MDTIYGGLTEWQFWVAVAITFGAGFVKGAIGFAMPLIMISAFNGFMPPQTALAALILCTLTTNVHQALRQGVAAAAGSAWTYRRFILATAVFIVISAQFVAVIPQSLMLGLLGVPVIAFAAVQLMGRSLALRLQHRERAETLLGVVGGIYGGISGVWGPPFIVYLLSIGAGKQESVRAQGVVFLIGAAVLTASHLQSGVLNATTLPLSAALIAPAAAGMWAGFRLQDRLDPVRFRRWTLVLLLVTGANMLRRAVGL